MLQVMESWFLCDRVALKCFFGKDFNEKQLPSQERSIEDIPKQEVYKALAAASVKTSKGRYGKGAHSFQLLAEIDPKLVVNASPWANYLLDTLRS